MLLKKETPKLLSVRADELPLLYNMIKSYNIIEAIDKNYDLHGNWVGSSAGQILGIWLCYMLSECDHRLSPVEEWVEERLELLQILSDVPDLGSVDFCDDKLGDLLSMFSIDKNWDKVETDINSSLLSVYKPTLDLGGEKEELPTFRLDAAPMQSYGSIKEDGLLQYGYSKHHADLPQFKIKLCSLDNSLNHFGYPICHLTVSGNQSDDSLYIPIIERTKSVLEKTPGYEKGNLYVGDNKFGSISNRSHVVEQEDYYLLPLSLVQFSKAKRLKTIKEQFSKEADFIQVYRIKKEGENEEKELVANGFEQEVELENTIIDENGNEKVLKWKERRLFVKSTAYATAQCKNLDNKLIKIETEIEALTVRKQGKEVLKTIESIKEKANNLLKINKLEGLLKIEIKETKTAKQIRRHLEKPARTEIISTFEIICERDQTAIENRKEGLGWQVYATNAPIEKLSFESCVWKYRYQSNIESRFDDLRNKIVPLLPVFLQKDDRIKGLVNVLMLVLKISATMEYKVAESLKKLEEAKKTKNSQGQKQGIAGLYEGNPRRTTSKPSIRRILRAFKGISISLVFVNNKLQLALMTELNTIQKELIVLLGHNSLLYNNLCPKFQTYFSDLFFSET